uniref:Uncharacterized protein n=1 Tax=Helianthus annuus TaxID=4232 RepID=A0A251SRQ9_HELAN
MTRMLCVLCVYRLISFGTCCLECWSGHGSRYLESQDKSNGFVHVVYETLNK